MYIVRARSQAPRKAEGVGWRLASQERPEEPRAHTYTAYSPGTGNSPQAVHRRPDGRSCRPQPTASRYY
eukprot:scaffold17888_cov149-Isochrysis_galbana.AAC.3